MSPENELFFSKLSNNRRLFSEPLLIRRKNDMIRLAVTCTPLEGKRGQVIGTVVTLQPMQQYKRLIERVSGTRAKITFGDILGRSSEFKYAIKCAEMAAASDSNVLLLGASGVGKEMFAQSIHNASNRSREPFFAINCAALPRELVSSELFGYEDGAFTGARRGGHAGKFELANGGTLFLDEIGEMPLDMQVNLLRVLQEGYITRVGGSKIIPVDVRIIAATNKDLKKEVEKGTFRSDLYYRLNVIPINLPPLRERKGDLPFLIKYFTRMKSIKLNKPIPVIEDKFYEGMLSYSWPGNIRELENYIENIVNFNGTPTIQIPLSSEDRLRDAGPRQDDDERVITLEDLERAAIVKCIQKFGGNMSRVSHSLGVCRSTLYNKIRQYNILV
jgi:transcriptional regulator with PAS, ATPase and Fis domain